MNYNDIIIDNKIDQKVLKEYLNALDKILEKYPRLLNRIDLITDFKNNFKITKNICKTFYQEKYNLSLIDKINFYNSSFAYTTLIKNNDNVDYILLSINEKLNFDKTYKKLSSASMLYEENINMLLYHEVGHMFSAIFGLLKDEEFSNNILTYMVNQNEYSKYSLTSPEEFIAENFILYFENKQNNNASLYIGNIIDDLYKFYASTELFERKNDISLLKKSRIL